jgi:hypothetical protein
MDTLVIPNGPDALAGETRIAVGPTTPLDMVRGETRVVIKSGKHVQLFNLHGGIYFAGTFTGSVTFDPHQLPHVVLKHAAGAPPKNRKKTLPQEDAAPAPDPDPPAPVKQKATRKKSKKAPVEPVAAEATLEKEIQFEYARAEAAELAAAAAAAAVVESDKPAKVRKPRTQEQKDAANERRRQQRIAKAAAPTTVDPMEED